MREHIQKILSLMNYPAPLSIHRFHSDEDGSPYGVWRIDYPDSTLVLKEAKAWELEIYRAFFREKTSCAPQLIASAAYDGQDYLLLEYIPGEDLRKCSREKLIHALDSLIAMQSAHWQDNRMENVGRGYEKSLPGRQNRREYLKDSALEAAYDAFLRAYASVPRTLCHDDLLPFNVLDTGSRAVFIDWEVGGILPYPVSLARLIAHGEEDPDAFFYMTDADRSFALDYYFDRLIRHKGILRPEYDKTMALFLFYEFCEWVYLGNKYDDAGRVRFQVYLTKAKEVANFILKT